MDKIKAGDLIKLITTSDNLTSPIVIGRVRRNLDTGDLYIHAQTLEGRVEHELRSIFIYKGLPIRTWHFASRNGTSWGYEVIKLG